MTLRELQKAINAALTNDLDSDCEVMLFNPDSPTLCSIIKPLQHIQVRKVQNYTASGESFRNKFLLLSSGDPLSQT
jgi:hypothetical protein